MTVEAAIVAVLHIMVVDTSPNRIAKKDPNLHYGRYEHGYNPDIDDYHESGGHD